MAMPLAVHDVLPSTSAEARELAHQSSVSGTRSPSVKLSYAEITNGKRITYGQNGKVQDVCNNDKWLDGSEAVDNWNELPSCWAPGLYPSPNAKDRVPNGYVTTNVEGELVAETANQPSQASPAAAASDASSASFSPRISPGAPNVEPDKKPSFDTRDVWQAAVENMERDAIIREKIGLIINKRYRILQKISFGSYGSIYSAVDLHTNKDVAVKFEIGSKPSLELHLKYENDVYHCMRGEAGVPIIYWFGSEYNYEILVMQLLGPSLEQLFSFCERLFSWETIVSLADQMLLRIWSLHSRGYLHRDIKPENFLMGLQEAEHLCYLVDFGLARRFRYRDNGKLVHIPFRKGKSLVGTAKYASINSHNGLELSRRDDLESLGYIIIEFINRELPWKDQRGKARFRSKQQSYNRIRNMKEQTDWTILCPKMAEWIYYCRQLGFSEEPNYKYLQNLLHSLLPVDTRPVGSDDFIQANQQQTLNSALSRMRQPSSGFSSAPVKPYSKCPENPFEAQSADADYSPFGKSYEAARSGDRKYFQRFDDGTGRYSWLMRRDSSPTQRYTYECLFRWTVPSGNEGAAVTAPHFRHGGSSFQFGNSYGFAAYNGHNYAEAK